MVEHTGLLGFSGNNSGRGCCRGEGVGVRSARREGAIHAVLEDGADRGDGSRLDQNAAPAGRLDALGAVAFGQRQNAEAGAKALLGMPASRSNALQFTSLAATSSREDFHSKSMPMPGAHVKGPRRACRRPSWRLNSFIEPLSFSPSLVWTENLPAALSAQQQHEAVLVL